MSITNKTVLYYSVLLLSLFILAVTLWLVSDSGHSFNELQKRRYESRLLAEELRRSSDDLTRMARTYVITGDPRFLEYFKEISAIRNGTSPRPENYENIYWDFISAHKNHDRKSGTTISLIDKMKALNFSESELSLLQDAKSLSDDLMKLETRAFNALQGLYQDGEGIYSVKGKPDTILAQNIVFGEAYYQAKYRIMEKIDQFYKLLDYRTEKEVNDVAQLQKIYQAIALALSIIIIVMVFIGYGLIKKDIIKPLNKLSEWIKQMHSGEYNFDAREFRNNEIGMIANAFAAMASHVSSNIFDLEYVSQTDPLTQISNRSALDRALINEMQRFEQHGTPCSILIMDIDHFKEINDRYGHLIGDKVLVEFVKVLRGATRLSDIPGRWGGEEFIVVCPNTDLEHGRAVAERIRKRISHHKFDEVGHVTASIGVSTFEIGESLEQTIQKADELLYKAKSEGRNRVC
ncbi:MAG: diguanylate cyclase [Thermoleophilia bacterium]|jgi:diguanylate cyclase (GGDEF)-like protein